MIEYGRIAWEAYSKSFATYTGDATLLPEWDGLIQPVRTAWDEAASTLIETWIHNIATQVEEGFTK